MGTENEMRRPTPTNNGALKWFVLILICITLVSSYFLTEAMTPLMTVLETQENWDSAEFGILHWGYAFFIVFCFGLIIGGILTDKFGYRVTGLISIVIMIIGGVIKFWAVEYVSNSLTSGTILGLRTQVFWVTFGYAIFAFGSENISSMSNKIIANWFCNDSLALAIGLKMSFCRIGMAASIALGPWVSSKWSIAILILIAIALLVVGLLTYLLFIYIDKRESKEGRMLAGQSDAGSKKKFRFRDLKNVVCNRGWWLVAMICVSFYASVVPFLKYSPTMMTDKYGVSTEYSGIVPSLLPFVVIFLSPLFGALYDRYGKGSTFLIIASAIIVFVFICFALPIMQYAWFAILLVVILGFAYAIVPAVIWPTISKLVPSDQLGSAYSFTYWMRSLGLSIMFFLVGWILDEYCKVQTVGGVTEYAWKTPMLMLSAIGLISLLLSIRLRIERRRMARPYADASHNISNLFNIESKEQHTNS